MSRTAILITTMGTVNRATMGITRTVTITSRMSMSTPRNMLMFTLRTTAAAPLRR